jgi:hypothetical protein
MVSEIVPSVFSTCNVHKVNGELMVTGVAGTPEPKAHVDWFRATGCP